MIALWEDFPSCVPVLVRMRGCAADLFWSFRPSGEGRKGTDPAPQRASSRYKKETHPIPRSSTFPSFMAFQRLVRIAGLLWSTIGSNATHCNPGNLASLGGLEYWVGLITFRASIEVVGLEYPFITALVPSLQSCTTQRALTSSWMHPSSK